MIAILIKEDDSVDYVKGIGAVLIEKNGVLTLLKGSLEIGKILELNFKETYKSIEVVEDKLAKEV